MWAPCPRNVDTNTNCWEKILRAGFEPVPTAAYGSWLCRALAESLLASTPSSSSGSSGDMVATDDALEATLPDDPEEFAQAVLARQSDSVPS